MLIDAALNKNSNNDEAIYQMQTQANNIRYKTQTQLNNLTERIK